MITHTFRSVCYLFYFWKVKIISKNTINQCLILLNTKKSQLNSIKQQNLEIFLLKKGEKYWKIMQKIDV
ncbi:MAG: hypothetical protein EAZ06_08595 [Cytophagales bacterium]|nr:MAG: hypothetical protein EAY69_11370 [Cytophagales bacterium]TAH28893.1 MAG: hypothetical protein EAZ06_08595 [Cytophagales bacterium]